jgi:replication factor A1
MKISDLKAGMKKVDLAAKVSDIGEPRDVNTRFGPARVATATLSDDSGQVKLSLWNKDIDRVKVGDTVDIKNGYINDFRGELQLNVGQYGKLETVKGKK